MVSVATARNLPHHMMHWGDNCQQEEMAAVELGMSDTSEPPRTVLAVSGRAESSGLIERALRGLPESGELMAVHVPEPGAAEQERENLMRLRERIEAAGGTWHTVIGQDVASALLGFARSARADRIVVGRSRSTRGIRRRDLAASLAKAGAEMDVIILPHSTSTATRRRVPRPYGPHGARLAYGWGLAALGPALLTATFLNTEGSGQELTLNFLCQLTVVVFVALLGGWWPALAAALTSTLLLNWFFTAPTGQWHIHEPLNVAALCLFLLVAAGVARVVAIEGRRTAEAGRARRQADTLFELSGGVIREGISVPALLEWLRRSFELNAVSLATRADDPAARRVLASAGQPKPNPFDCDSTVIVDAEHMLLIDGLTQDASDQGVMEAFAGRVATVLQHQALADARVQAQELEAGNAMRTALLAAVSHDLRTPLAGIKASASSLRLSDVVLTEQDKAELLATVEESADKLSERIEDLLSMSRIQAGHLVVHRGALQMEDLVASARRDLSGQLGDSHLDIEIPADCPAVSGDYGLAVRVIANLVENGARHGGGQRVDLRATWDEQQVHLHVIDHGPGVPEHEKENIFQPFQRRGDRNATAGLGLGLAVARGLAEGMGGRVEVRDTSGGGATMIFSLPLTEEIS